MRLLVCGGRDYTDRARVWAELNDLAPEVVIHGGASGADALAGQWAARAGIGTYQEMYVADWHAHVRSAGPRRNQRMLDEGMPDMVLAFPGGRGTADMVRRARSAGVPVKMIA